MLASTPIKVTLMLEWIELNKEWFLSGVGIFVVTTVIAVFSSLLTLYIKLRSDIKKRKIISIQTKINKYKIETTSKDDDLAVSYKGHIYNDLCQYLVSIENIGPVAVEAQKFIITLPRICQKIDFQITKTSNTINHNTEVFSMEDKYEELHSFSRIEPLDGVKFSYIIDSEMIDDIDIQPRGADGVKYNLKGYESTPELKHLIVYVALFLLIGAVPIMGGMLQTLVLLAASNTIINVVEEFRAQSRTPKALTIKDIRMDGDSIFTINQK